VGISQNKKRKKKKKIPLGIINISTNLEFSFLIPRKNSMASELY
jgi:hypothetical protein